MEKMRTQIGLDGATTVASIVKGPVSNAALERGSRQRAFNAARLFTLKRVIDLLVATILLVALLPICLVIAALVGLGGGPVFFKHTRIGRGGAEFPCFKFRTMITNGDEVLKAVLAGDPAARREWEVDHKLRNDPRITPIGRFLRKSSLDELPQLLNVIRGDMSLVGPRPVVKNELELYSRAAKRYVAVRPGITGLWQVMGRNNTSYARRVALDSYYVSNVSPKLDAVILLKTIRVVLTRHGAY